MKLAHRVLLGALLVVTVLVTVAVTLGGVRLRAQLDRLLVEQATREARLVALQWTGGGQDADSLADAAGAALGHRVTLIDRSGRVIGDSHVDRAALAALEDQTSRPEVAAALQRGLGVSGRPSASSSDEEHVLVAVAAPAGVARVSIGAANRDAIVARARRDVLIAGLIALLAALALAASFSRSASRPIAELRDVARAIAAGDSSRRPALSTAGEIGELGVAVHRMAEQLDSRLKALQAEDALLGALVDSLLEGVIAVNGRREVVRVNESGRRLLGLRATVPFSVDLLPRDRALRSALADALTGHVVERAEVLIEGRTLALNARPLADGGAVLALYDLSAERRLEIVRRDFVANVSHELKTPLTVIGGFAETLATEPETKPEQRQFAEAIRTNTTRMQRIVDDLLDLSRIESGGWVPTPSLVDVAAAAGDAVNQYCAPAQRRGVTLQIAVHPAARSAYVDPTALRQILANFVDNAVRHTREGGEVVVFTRRDNGGVWVGTRDTGVGIAAEHLPRIFERFYRVDAARSRAAGGTGLGLSIVRHLVEAHGGRVRAESALGRGTVVEAFFPEAAVTGS